MKHYSWTPTYVLQSLTLQQLMHWFNVALEIEGVAMPAGDYDPDAMADEINAAFTYNEEKKRWE